MTSTPCLRATPAALFLVACLFAPVPGLADTSPLAETGAERTAVASPQDRSFINLYVRAGLATREAGQLAARRARTPDLRRLGGRLDESFRLALQQLDTLAAPLGLPPLPQEPDAEHKAAADRLQQAEPAAFDPLFLAQQIHDQEDLLQILDIEAGTGDNPGLAAFAARERDRLLESLQQTRTLAAQLPPSRSAGLSTRRPD